MTKNIEQALEELGFEYDREWKGLDYLVKVNSGFGIMVGDRRLEESPGVTVLRVYSGATKDEVKHMITALLCR